MCTATEPAAPASTGQALAMVRAGLGYLADCDAGSLGTAAQADALIGLEAAEAQHTAARARILAAFTAQQGYEADGYYGPASWLRRDHPGHQGRRRRGHRLGAAPRRAPGDRRGAGGRAAPGVAGAADL